MSNVPEISFSPEIEEMAIKLTAFDIMRQLCREGRITENELKFLAGKHQIDIEEK